MMLAFIAELTMHTGHQVAYLYMFVMPYLIRYLFQAVHPTDPELRKATYNIYICESLWRWPLQGRRTHSIPKRLRRKKKPSVCLQTKLTIKTKLRTYLVPIAVSILRVGC